MKPGSMLINIMISIKLTFKRSQST
jgi:hypothetical protein